MSNSEGYTCSDISVFRSYGYEDLCSDSYDTNDFTASESCVACGGGQVVQDTWYETEEVQEVTVGSVTIRCGTIVQDSYGDGCAVLRTNPHGVVVTTTTISHQTKCAARAEVVNRNTHSINQQQFASTLTTTKSTPMDILAPTSTFSTTTRTSRTTVRHKQTHRSSPRPVCVALVEEVRPGLVERNQAKLRIVVKTHQPIIWTHRISHVCTI